MKPRALVIALDSFGFHLLQTWLNDGSLPHLQALRRRGALGLLRSAVHYQNTEAPFANTEALWVMALTGLLPDQTGYWSSMRYDPQTYSATSDIHMDGYDYAEHKPFYALGPGRPVVVFDIPVSRVCEGPEGVQIAGWGGHAPFVQADSRPKGLLEQINQKHGRDQLLHADNGEFWNERYLRWLMNAAHATSRKRSAICRELMAANAWELFLTSFGEAHSTAHDLWFLSQDHPLSPNGKVAFDPMLEAYRGIDRAVGEIIAAAPADAHVLCFSLHGMGPNSTDLASMVLLPEVLYRWNYPGRVGLGPGRSGKPEPMVTNNVSQFWGAEIWRRRWEKQKLRRWLQRLLPAGYVGPGRECDLESPFSIGCQPPHLGWLPAAWYRRVWPRMKAFALPAFTDGHVRINLKGREPQGLVSSSEYAPVCGEVTALLKRLRDGRTGELLVDEVYRTRSSAEKDNPKLPYADLVVCWHNQPVDVLDSPDVGRIGPLPFYRTGGHNPEGFLLACGPGIEPGGELPEGRAVDLAPTVLRLLHMAIPPHYPGRSLLGSNSD
jgi:predicted AlkP superfamily phosphohydrolase/phosphomutase